MFWNRKEKVKTRIGVEINREGKIDIVCQWPNTENQEEAEKIAEEMSSLVINSFRHDVIKFILLAIANHGVKTDSEKIARLIQSYISKAAASLPNYVKVDSNEPVVQPRKAFLVRGE